MPTQLINLRIWSAADCISVDVDRILHALVQSGFEVIEKSQPYSCRPPKHSEARVYIKLDR